MAESRAGAGGKLVLPAGPSQPRSGAKPRLTRLNSEALGSLSTSATTQAEKPPGSWARLGCRGLQVPQQQLQPCGARWLQQS